MYLRVQYTSRIWFVDIDYFYKKFLSESSFIMASHSSYPLKINSLHLIVDLSNIKLYNLSSECATIMYIYIF